MRHATEEYVGQIEELKDLVDSLRREIQDLFTENMTMQSKISELESKVFGGSTK